MASISAAGSLYITKVYPKRLVECRKMMSGCSPKSGRFCEVSSLNDANGSIVSKGDFNRREALVSTLGILVGALYAQEDGAALANEYADMPAIRGKDYGKSKMRYSDYTETESGLQYKDLRLGSGPIAKMGETVVVDWDGYTIGYYGRIFEARNKTKGGSFEDRTSRMLIGAGERRDGLYFFRGLPQVHAIQANNVVSLDLWHQRLGHPSLQVTKLVPEGDDKDYFKFKLGSQQVIPAFEEAVVGMALGGIRRIIVPPELGYPDNDYNKSGPRPTTFSGQRALDFVLRNQGLIDKTLLFDIELLKIMSN